MVEKPIKKKEEHSITRHLIRNNKGPSLRSQSIMEVKSTMIDEEFLVCGSQRSISVMKKKSMAFILPEESFDGSLTS